MENNLTEEQRRLLAEWLDEKPTIGCNYDWNRSLRDCIDRKCAECKYYFPIYRSFTTWQDLGDLKEKLVDERAVG